MVKQEVVKEYGLGLMLLVLVVAAARLLAMVIPGIGTVTAAIILGIGVGNLTPLADLGKRGVRFCEKRLLNGAIVLMGLELQVAAAAGIGGGAVAVILGVVFTSLFLGWIISRRGSLPPRLAFLLGVGNGICGSAAIASCAPVIGADKEELGISVAVINLLGAGAIFLLPLAAGILGLSAPQSALLLGGTIQAVGQTVAASLVMGAEVASLAILVKMGRVLMLGGVVVFLTALGRGRLFGETAAGKEAQREAGSEGGEGTGIKPPGGRINFPVPPFIIGFLLAAVAVNLLPLPERLLGVLDSIKKWMLYLAMAGIGTGIRFATIRRFGLSALGAGTVIFLVNLLLTGGIIAVSL